MDLNAAIDAAAVDSYTSLHTRLDQSELLCAVGQWHRAIRGFRDVLLHPQGDKVKGGLGRGLSGACVA